MILFPPGRARHLSPDYSNLKYGSENRFIELKDGLGLIQVLTQILYNINILGRVSLSTKLEDCHRSL